MHLQYPSNVKYYEESMHLVQSLLFGPVHSWLKNIIVFLLLPGEMAILTISTRIFISFCVAIPTFN